MVASNSFWYYVPRYRNFVSNAGSNLIIHNNHSYTAAILIPFNLDQATNARVMTCWVEVVKSGLQTLLLRNVTCKTSGSQTKDWKQDQELVNIVKQLQSVVFYMYTVMLCGPVWTGLVVLYRLYTQFSGRNTLNAERVEIWRQLCGLRSPVRRLGAQSLEQQLDVSAQRQWIRHPRFPCAELIGCNDFMRV